MDDSSPSVTGEKEVRKAEEEVVETKEYVELILVLVLDLARNLVGHLLLKLHQVEVGQSIQ
jgi:hypothetical protein